MAGEHGAGVFDACAAFDGGFEEVAQLGGNVEDCCEEEGLPERFGDVQDGVPAGDESVGDGDDQSSGEHAACDRGNGAHPGFAGAKTGGELAFAEGSTDVECGDVSGPDADHEEEDEGGAVFLFPEKRYEGEGVGDVDEAEETLGGVGKDLVEG